MRVHTIAKFNFIYFFSDVSIKQQSETLKKHVYYISILLLFKIALFCRISKFHSFFFPRSILVFHVQFLCCQNAIDKRSAISLLYYSYLNYYSSYLLKFVFTYVHMAKHLNCIHSKKPKMFTQVKTLSKHNIYNYSRLQLYRER